MTEDSFIYGCKYMLDSGSTCRSAACSHCLEDNMQNQAKKKSKPNPSSQSTRTTRKTQVRLKPCPCGQDRLHIYSKPAAKRWLETMGSSDVQLKELEKIPVKDLVHMIKPTVSMRFWWMPTRLPMRSQYFHDHFPVLVYSQGCLRCLI